MVRRDAMRAGFRVASFELVAAVALCIAVPLVAGCGPRSDRLAIHGRVTLDGAALDNGSIRFSTVAGEKLHSSGAMIQAGAYDIPQEKGLPPGKYRVEISAPDTKAKPIVVPSAPGEPPAPPMAPERIPAEYNEHSTKTVDVDAAQENEFNFDIASRAGK